MAKPLKSKLTGDAAYQKTVLPNGLRVVTSTMPHTRSVSVCFFIGAGSRYERDAEAGISHFLEHGCFKGTTQRPAAQMISEAIEGVGGYMNASTDREMTVYWCKVARPHFGLALELLEDMLCHSLFEPKEMEKERKVILEELSMSYDHPEQRVDLLIDEVVWPKQAMGRDVGGTKESVSGITPKMMRVYQAQEYVPQNIVLTVAGNIGHQEVIDAVQRLDPPWSLGTPRPLTPAKDGQRAPRHQVERRKSEQVHLAIALRGLAVTHPDRFALDMLNVVFGEGMSSRLFVELREKRGLAYDVMSRPSHYLDTGVLTVNAGVDPKNAYAAIDAIMEQLALLREPVSEAELQKAKELTKGRLLLRMEDTRSVAGWLGGQELLLGRIDTVDEVVEQVERITVEDLQRVGKALVHKNKLNVVLLGPVRDGKALEAHLKL